MKAETTEPAGRKRRNRFAAAGLRRHAFDPVTKLCWRCGRSEQAVVDGLIPCLEAENVVSIVPEIVRRALVQAVDGAA